ncbi:hypothetical protein AB0E18_30750, partial [Streptomyces sp. NPDC047968]
MPAGPAAPARARRPGPGRRTPGAGTALRRAVARTRRCPPRPPGGRRAPLRARPVRPGGPGVRAAPAGPGRRATPEDGKGAIVLMHDSGGDRSQTVAALDR